MKAWVLSCCTQLAYAGCRVYSIAVDHHGTRCVTTSGDGTAQLWGVQTGICDWVMLGHGNHNQGQCIVLDVAIAVDSILAATASDDFTVKIWDLDDQQCLQTLEGHSGWVSSVEVTAASHLFAIRPAAAFVAVQLKRLCTMSCASFSVRCTVVAVSLWTSSISCCLLLSSLVR